MIQDFVFDKIEKVAELDKNYFKSAYSISIGSIGLLPEKANIFCINKKITDLSSWNKKEKYLFYTLFKDEPNNDFIVDSYNNFVYKNKINKIDLFKDISMINKYLIAQPYDNPFFVEQVYEKIILWNSLGDPGKDKILKLKDAFSNFMPIDTINNYLSDNLADHQEAMDEIKTLEKMSKIEQSRNPNLTIISGMVTTSLLVLPEAQNQIASVSQTASEFITNAISLAHISNNLNPNIMLAITASTGVVFAFYTLYKTVSELLPKVADKIKGRFIDDIRPSQLNNDSFYNKALSNKLLSPIINTKNDFNLFIKNDFNKYFAIATFLNEKIYEPSTIMNAKFFRDFNFKSEEAKRLNNLSTNDIHNIAVMPTITSKTLVALNDFNDKETVILKNLSKLEDFYAKKQSLPEVLTQSSNVLPQQILDLFNNPIFNNTTDNEKKLLTYYLQILNSYEPGHIQYFAKSLQNDDQEFIDTLSDNIKSILQSNIESNKEEIYFHRALKLKVKNNNFSDNKNNIEQLILLSQSHNFSSTEIISREYRSLLLKIKESISNTSDLILTNIESKISKFRQNGIQIVRNNILP